MESARIAGPHPRPRPAGTGRDINASIPIARWRGSACAGECVCPMGSPMLRIRRSFPPLHTISLLRLAAAAAFSRHSFRVLHDATASVRGFLGELDDRRRDEKSDRDARDDFHDGFHALLPFVVVYVEDRSINTALNRRLFRKKCCGACGHRPIPGMGRGEGPERRPMMRKNSSTGYASQS